MAAIEVMGRFSHMIIECAPAHHRATVLHPFALPLLLHGLVHKEEFKQETVHLLESSGKPVAELAHDLGNYENNLYRWRGVYGRQPESRVKSGVGELEVESKRLRRENGVLRRAFQDDNQHGHFLSIVQIVTPLILVTLNRNYTLQNRHTLTKKAGIIEP